MKFHLMADPRRPLVWSFKKENTLWVFEPLTSIFVDDEAFGSELGVDSLQTPILRGEAALARSVHDQHRLASELLQGHLLTGIRGETEVVDRIPHTPIVPYR